MGYLGVKFKCCRKRAQRSDMYKLMMRKASSRIAKEMDLQKFLFRQRIFITSLLSLLKSRQSYFVDKYS